MDFRKLRYFLSVVEMGSFHRAAEKLHVAQPALSKSIHSIEQELGARLLVRHSKGVEATEEGAALYRHASEILSAWRVAEADVKERSRELSGTVSIGAPPTLALGLFAELCAQVDKIYPLLRLELKEGVGHSLWEAMHAEDLDLAILTEAEGSESIITELIGYEDAYLVAAQSRELPSEIDELGTLLDFPLIITTRATQGRSWFEEMTINSGIAFNIRYRVESPGVAKGLVKRGLGVAILPYSGIREEVGGNDYQISRLKRLKLPRILATRKSRYLHPSVAFVRGVMRKLLIPFTDSPGRSEPLGSHPPSD